MKLGLTTVHSLIVGLLAAGCGHGESPPAVSAPPDAVEARPPAAAGRFYEAQPFALDATVAKLLKAAKPSDTRGRLVAAVVPHAGYEFSGTCAASVFAKLSDAQYDRVIVLGPSHYVRFEGIALPDPRYGAFRTPLGDVPLDRAVCEALGRKPHFAARPGVDAQEHSIEVELPFLQKTLGRFKLVPLLCGAIPDDALAPIAESLIPYLDERTLLVASSDFTHYGPNYDFVPFESDVPSQLHGWLKASSGQIAALDVAGFGRHCRETQDTICGERPIRVLMAALAAGGRAVRGQVLDTTTSGDVVGDFRNSVSYAAIGFFTQASTNQEGYTVKEHRSGTWTPGLTQDEQNTLFAIARDTLRWCVERKPGGFSFDGYAITPVMKRSTATFVTLKIKGRLRGCIGSLAPVEPLFMSVHNNAVNAALRDPRFNPVSAGELKRIEVDVSILSPVNDIPSIADFKLGQQGIIFEKGVYRAVYLPEVAVEQGWTVEETMSSLSEKAGLPADAWRQGARFKVFESVVLSE